MSKRSRAAQGSRSGSGRSALRILPSAALFVVIASGPGSAAARPTTEAEVVAIAVANNPSLRAAIADYESARWALRAAESQFVPYWGLDAGVTRNRIPTLSIAGVTTGESQTAEMGASIRKRFATGSDLSLRLGGTHLLSRTSIPGSSEVFTMGPGYGLNLRLAFNQPLWRGAGREVGEAEIAASQVRKTAAQLAEERTANDLLANVVEAYWQAWYAREALEIQRESLAVATRQRDEARARAEVGSIARVDVLAFETRVASRQEDVAAAELEVERRTNELLRILANGREPLEPTDEPTLPPSPPRNVAELALSSSLELREAEAAVQLATVQARTADDSLKPRLDLDAYAEARGLGNRDVGAALGQLAGLGAVSAHVGLTFEAPMTDTQRRAAAARASFAVEAASAREAEVRNRVLASIETELHRESAARRRLELAQETVQIAELQLEAEQARYETGSSTAIAVLQGEDDLRGARLRVARARVDLVEANTAIARITGSLLGRYSVELGDDAGSNGLSR